MADFDTVFNFVIGDEDALKRCETVADPTKADPNARAISGINSHFYPIQFAAINALPPSERLPAVKEFYRAEFFTPVVASIKSTAIACVLVDAEFNMGRGTGVKLLQNACNLVSDGPLLNVDGILGHATVGFVNLCNPAALVSMFQHVRATKYRAIGGPNLEGWLTRAAKTPPMDA